MQMETLQRATASLQSIAANARMEAEEEEEARRPPRHARPDIASQLAVSHRQADPDEEEPTPDGGEGGPEGPVHFGVSCDGCGAGPPLFGPVMKCTECEDFDFCARCYAGRDRFRHPRGHRFSARPPPGGSDRSGLATMLARLMEEEMLREALRLSTEGGGEGGESAAPQEDPEVRAAEALSRLPRVKYVVPTRSAATDDQSEECALCLEEYKNNEEVLKTDCGHLFHESCLGPWLIRSLSCPLCKGEVH